MKMNEKLLAIIVGLLMIASCVKVTEVQNGTLPKNHNGEYPILFSNQTKAQTTSVSGTGYDEFKLFVWNSLNDTIMKPYSVVATDVNEYHYEDLPGQEIKYYRKASDWYDFIGVIPGNHNMALKNGAVKVEGVKSFTVDDNLADKAANVVDTLSWSSGLAVDSPEELLTAYKRVPKNKYGSVVSLPFKHENAVIFLGFSSDRNDTKIVDYAPGTPGIPAVPATSDSVKYTKKTVKFIDELVAGSEVQVGIGFYGASSPKLRKNQPNPLYVGENNGTWKSKDWLLSIKDAVNSQFVYYRLNQVTNSTSKTETTDDWESAASNKNIFMMKLADGVDKTEFAAGNDAFWNALVAHDEGTTEPWVGGSPADSFKNMFKKAYDEGWRVIRINVSDANSNQVLVFLSSNIEVNTQICETIPGNPGSPAVPGSPAIEGIRVFSADSTGVNNIPTDTLYCVHIPHTVVADATISATGCELSNRATSNEVIQYSLPENTTLSSTPVWSPTTFYALPGDSELNYLVVKLSFVYNGEAVYDVRVPIKLPDEGLQASKYYKYELYITSRGNGTDDPNEARDEKDEIVIENNPVINVRLVEAGYAKGDSKKLTI